MTMDTPPLLPSGCHVQGCRTLHLDLGEALAGLGFEETPVTRVGAAVMALEAAHFYGLALAIGGDPPARPDRMEQVARTLETASDALLELMHVPDLPEEAKRFAALAAVWVAVAVSRIPSETGGQKLRLEAVAREIADRAGLHLRRLP